MALWQSIRNPRFLVAPEKDNIYMSLEITLLQTDYAIKEAFKSRNFVAPGGLV